MPRVTAADRIWLDLERTDNPITITGILDFDGAITVADVQRLFRERVLAPHPRFGCRVRHDGRHWSWEPVPDLDLNAHVHRMGLPAPFDESALHDVVGQLMSTRLDPDRPLWQIHVIERPDGQTTLVARLHHAIADGISLARVLLSLGDAAGDEAWENDRRRRGLGALLSKAWRSVSGAHERRMAARWTARMARATSDLLTMPSEPPTSLRGPLGVHKRVAWTDVWTVDEVKQVAKAAGGTINDVVLATLAGALRRHLEGLGEDPVPLRTFVPVNLRPLDRPLPRDLGNMFGLVIVPLPVDARSDREALDEVMREMRRIKRSPEPLLTFLALQFLGAVPDPLTRLGVGWFGRMASSITTNVPGPREPIALAGVPVRAMMFWVPQSADVGLGLSIFSYAGRIRVGVAADALRVADPGEIVAQWHASFEALQEAVLGREEALRARELAEASR